MHGGILFLVSWVLIGSHPVPRENHDRRILVRTTSEGIEVLYRLEVDEQRAVLDLVEHDRDLSPVKSKEDIHRLYLDLARVTLPRGLILKGPNSELPLIARRGETHLSDHLRVDLFLFCPKTNLPENALLQLEEANYQEDGKSLLQWGLWPGLEGGVSPRSPKILQWKAVWADPWEPAETTAQPTQNGQSNQHNDGLIDLLLGSEHSLPVLLLIAGLFGAGHALTPGHGKTMVAAYLVGERGTVSQAILLGVVTTLTHTSAVMMVAGVLPWVLPDASSTDVQRVLMLLGGLLLSGMGFWLLLTRLSGGADHYHGPGGHTHGPPPTGTSTMGVILLGITGGLIPCWDAVAMLVFAMASGRIWFALPLLICFSLGLALVLVALGISVVKSRDWIEGRVGGGAKFDRWTGRIALFSAVLILLMGLWLCQKAFALG